MKIYVRWIGLLLVALLVACGNGATPTMTLAPTAAPVEEPTTPAGDSYPGPAEETVTAEPYPEPSEEQPAAGSYPEPSEEVPALGSYPEPEATTEIDAGYPEGEAAQVAPIEEGNVYWSLVIDARTDVSFAIPCFWIADIPTPEQDPSGLGSFSISNYTQEWVTGLGDKAQDLVWEKGGLKIDVGYLQYAAWNLASDAGLDELAAAMYPAGEEMSSDELIATEVVDVNGQPGIELTVRNPDTEVESSFYLLKLDPDYALSFSVYPPEAIDHPDVQSILQSLAFSADVGVRVPSQIPAAPPEGVPAACLKGVYDSVEPLPATAELTCPAEDEIGALGCAVQDALRSRDVDAIASLMADPFAIGYWRSEGISTTPADAASELVDLRLPADTSNLTFTQDPTQFPLLDGMPADRMYDPDLDISLIIYSDGWGAEGQGGALLYVTRQPGGGVAWHGIVLAMDGFK